MLRRSLIRKVSTSTVQLRQLRSLLRCSGKESISADHSQVVNYNIYSNIVEYHSPIFSEHRFSPSRPLRMKQNDIKLDQGRISHVHTLPAKVMRKRYSRARHQSYCRPACLELCFIVLMIFGNPRYRARRYQRRCGTNFLHSTTKSICHPLRKRAMEPSNLLGRNPGHAAG